MAGVATFQGGFDPNRDSYFNKAAWTDPGPLQFGNAPSRDGDVRGFSNHVEDVSIFKVTTFNERYKLRFEAQGGNVTNRVVFCDPNTNFSSAQFGQHQLAVQPAALGSVRHEVRILSVFSQLLTVAARIRAATVRKRFALLPLALRHSPGIDFVAMTSLPSLRSEAPQRAQIRERCVSPGRDHAPRRSLQ